MARKGTRSSGAVTKTLLFLGFGVASCGGLAAPVFEYTHMEVNAQLWSCVPDRTREDALRVIVDPLVGRLDFGLPGGIYEGTARVLKDREAAFRQMVEHRPSLILITQSWADHLHPPTLTRLRSALPKRSFRVLAPPSGEQQLRNIFHADELQILRPGDITRDLPGAPSGMACSITATEGSLVGPPWSARENGYAVSWGSSASSSLTVYYEPHSDVDVRNGRRPRFAPKADVVIAPVVKQALRPTPVSKSGSSDLSKIPSPPTFTLVHGGDRALSIAAALGANTLIPLSNGDIETSGSLASFVEACGSRDETVDLAARSFPTISVLDPTPGKTLRVEQATPPGPSLVS